MDRRWLPLNALRAFEAAGRHRSFTAAAQSLLVTQSAVSRHVIGLEDLIGIPLFERKPHQLALTDAGRRLLPVVTRAFDRIDEALEEVRAERAGPRRSLRVALPHTFAHQLAVPILKDFRAEHPDIGIDIDSRIVSGPMERGADVAVIYSEPKVTDRVLDLLWMVRLTILCHPDVAARAEGTDLGRFLAAHDLLHVRLEDRPKTYLWEMVTRTAGCPEVKVDRGLVFDTAQMAVQYALSGEGLALVDPLLFQAEIAAGRLVRPFDLMIDDGYGYYLATDPDDLGDTAVSVFRSWLIRRFSAPPFAPERRA
ncbi:LysR substrate-binding domain-containing protein [Prosthecomicrobium sp. N25]|uniref:LysR substrate-binding domain-containing protein n=1 Tax=Prosthecomicrobium sp. N25 TaxID=3129254 RepID=UPI003077A92B